jgi:hypothetical protein
VTEEQHSTVTREELRAELKALSNRHLLYLGVAVGLIRLDLPTPVTVGAVALMIVKGAATILLGLRT